MRPTDPFHISIPKKRENIILFAGVGYTHFSDECFVVTDGVASLPHEEEAAKLTADTALWAYKVVRLRPYYWTEKLELLKRIFRSTNLTLWQRRRDPGHAEGLASALMVLIAIRDYFWVGSAGNCNSFLYRDGLIEILTKRDVDADGMLTKAVGFARKQLIPTMRSERLLEQDIILLATDSFADYVNEDEMRTIFESTGTTQESVADAIAQLVKKAKDNGSGDAISLCLVKRIVI
jgi:serine/threonine protein phosphatase PrpC